VNRKAVKGGVVVYDCATAISGLMPSIGLSFLPLLLLMVNVT
jgi:hypothetical protein